MASDVSWVETTVDSGTIDDGGVKIHLPSIGDNYEPSDNTFSQPMPSPQFPAQGNDNFQLDFDGIKDQLTTHIAGSLLNNGSQQASSFLNFYAHIDWIRPHFDVSPGEVGRRLFGAFVPGWRKDFGEGNADLYGPTMIVFTLISILVFTMKGNSARTNDGSLMGVAFGISFTYWLFTSLWYYILAYSVASELSFLHVLSITGYGMLGCCVSLLPRLFLLPGVITLASFAVFGSLSGLSLSYLFFKKANRQKSGMVVGALVLATHAIFLFYLYSFFVTRPAEDAQKSFQNLENLIHKK